MRASLLRNQADSSYKKRRKISRWNSKLQHAKFVSFFEHRVYSSRCAFFVLTWAPCGRRATPAARRVRRPRRCCLVASLAGNEILAANDTPTHPCETNHTHIVLYTGGEWTNLNRSVRWLTSNENWSLSFFSLNTVVTLTNKRQWWWLG